MVQGLGAKSCCYISPVANISTKKMAENTRLATSNVLRALAWLTGSWAYRV